MRRRDVRESQALKHLVRVRRATAIDLAAAATNGEHRQHRVRFLDNLGMQIGSHFVKRGFATVDQYNRFHWVAPK